MELDSEFPHELSFLSQGYTPEDILVPYIDPYIAFVIRQQLAQYHLILDLVPRGGLIPQEDFRLCLLAETDVFDTRLAYPLLAKPCNIFLGFSIIKQVGIYIQGVRSLFPKCHQDFQIRSGAFLLRGGSISGESSFRISFRLMALCRLLIRCSYLPPLS